jgi:hypothetical protein
MVCDLDPAPPVQSIVIEVDIRPSVKAMMRRLDSRGAEVEMNVGVAKIEQGQLFHLSIS